MRYAIACAWAILLLVPGLASAQHPGIMYVPPTYPAGYLMVGPGPGGGPAVGGGGAGGESYDGGDYDGEEDLGFETAGSGGGIDFVGVSAGSYIDWAIPVTNFMIRTDAGYNNRVPDRAEFFYPQCGCFGGGARGPPLPETSVDYQEVSFYIEKAFSQRFSMFAELPVRFLNPEVNDNTAGMSDMNAGFKFALLADPCCGRYLTVQLRAYAPTGDGDRGLGNDHFTLEPSLLFWRRMGDTAIFGEFRDWIPIGGSRDRGGVPGEYAGNILRYGVGASRLVYEDCRFSVAPTAEVVGWTVLGGKKFDLADPNERSADRDSIVNLKFGVRVGMFGGSALGANSNVLGISYGKSITGDAWYEHILRVEYRTVF